MTASASSDSRQILDVELRYISASPTNPRKSFPKVAMKELTQSIKERGVREPVTVRAKTMEADCFELVHGERRWRASKAAGKETVPAILIEATDQEVLELQLMEHGLHEDLSPLEEASAYEHLHKKFGVPVASIAKKIGKSGTYVYGRLNLCKLEPEPKKAFLDGELTLDAAQMLARVPAKLQAKALEDILDNYAFDLQEGSVISGAAAGGVILDHFMLKLVDAPFDRGDAELVKKAGACMTCPKRTGNQAELFADIKSPDLCTDPDCHKEKVDAWWARKSAEASTKGKSVLSDTEAKKVFDRERVRSDSRYVDLKEKNYTDPKMRTWGELLGKQKPPVVLARDEDGGVHELVTKEEAGLALKKAGGAAAKLAPDAKQRSAPDAHTVKMQRESWVRRKAADGALALLVAAAVKKGPTIEVLRVVVFGLIREVWADRVKAIVARRGLAADAVKTKNVFTKATHVDNHKTLQKLAAGLKLPELMGLAVELVASRDAYSVHHRDHEGDALAQACAELKVDWGKCQADAKAEQKAKSEGKKQPKAGKAAKKSKAKGHPA